MRRALTIACVVVASVAASACSQSDRNTAIAEFADVGDLVSRANVQQSDAVVGTVTSIDLVERGDEWIARVEMRLDPETKATSTTRAVIRSTSLLGEKYVDLVPGPGGEPLGGDPIPLERTDKAPELEDVFSQLGAILASGALEDLAQLSTAGAMILEGQEDNVGRVLDGTAKLVASLRREREALAAGLEDLADASRTLAGGSDEIGRALEVGDDALRIVAAQRGELEQLVVQLDRLGKPLGDLTRQHKGDVDAQVRAVTQIVPKLHEARDALEAAVAKLPSFTKLFAQAIPGDYVQLNALVESLPIGMSGSDLSLGRPSDWGAGVRGSADALAELLLEATR